VVDGLEVVTVTMVVMAEAEVETVVGVEEDENVTT
jgi:hypothetical protein